MTESITECPSCHYRFNYEFIPGASVHAIRLGNKRIFRCPNCKELHKFRITDFGSDPNLPSHGDNAETGIGARIWVLLLVPTLGLTFSGAFMPFFIGARNLYITFGLIAAGLIWLAFYLVYLIRSIT